MVSYFYFNFFFNYFFNYYNINCRYITSHLMIAALRNFLANDISMLLDSLPATRCRLTSYSTSLGSLVCLLLFEMSRSEIRTDNGHASDGKRIHATHTDLRVNWFSVFSAGEIANVPNRPARKCQLLHMYPSRNVNTVTKEYT